MARGPEPGPARGVPPGRLVLLLLLLNTGHLSGVSSAQELNGFSLHPPYFNLAEGTRITASATCGEDGARSITDLYCKLVGGPVSGDPSQTIQVFGGENIVPQSATQQLSGSVMFPCEVLLVSELGSTCGGPGDDQIQISEVPPS
ncbi:unnamed protein product [Arctogadus glacialis]